MRFHHRRIERYTVSPKRLEQLIKNRHLSAKEHADKIERIQKKGHNQMKR